MLDDVSAAGNLQRLGIRGTGGEPSTPRRPRDGVARTADDFMPAYYVMAVSLISFVSALGLPETRQAAPAGHPDPA